MGYLKRDLNILLLLAFSVGLNAQSLLKDTFALEDVTVGIVQYGDRNRATGSIGLVNTEIAGIDPAINIESFINLVPGVYMASGGYNTNRLIIRGVGSRTPYTTNRIRAYLDDIPLTTGDGISNLEDIDVTAIGNIEILKGPSSAIYGSGLGGAVKLSSRYPDKNGFTANINNETGSFGTFRTSATAAFKKQRFSLFTGYARSTSNGYRENSRYLRNNFHLNAKYFRERNVLSLTLSYVDLYAGIPSSLNADDFYNNPSSAAGNWLAVKGHEMYQKFGGGLSIQTELTGYLKNKLILFGSFSNPYESRPFNILDDRSFSAGFRDLVQLTIQNLKLTAGAEFFHENYNWQIYETDMGSQGNLLMDNSERRQFLNLVAYGHYEPARKLTIDMGINLNLLSYNLKTEYHIDSTDQSGSYRYDPVFSPRLGINYHYLDRHYLYVSGGHGFSAPSVEETLLPEGTINNNLKPETGWNFEVGNRSAFFLNRLKTEISLYAVHLRNLLVTKRITEEIFTGINAGSALNTGIEFQGDFNLLNPALHENFRLDLAVNYTLNKNRFLDFIDDGVDHSGNELPGIPGQVLQIFLNGSLYQKFFLRLDHRFLGKQFLNDENTSFTGGYHVSDIRIAYEKAFGNMPFGIRIYGGARNIFNTHYASMILVNAPSLGGNPPRYYYPGLPRNFYLGISFIIN